MGGKVAGRHREPPARHDEDQQPTLDEVARAVGEEGVLDALVLLVPVVGRVDVGEAEGPVCDGGGEQVRGEGAVEAARRFFRPVPVKLHAVGLDGDVAPIDAYGSVTAVTAIGVDAGTAAITVTARDSDGNSVSDAFDVKVPAAQQQQAVEAPGPVTGLTVTASAEGSVTVSWQAPESGGSPDGYIVHISPEDGGKGRTKTPKASKTQVNFENLEPGRTYAVWVRAENDAGKGERVHATITVPEAEAEPPLSGGGGQQGGG